MVKTFSLQENNPGSNPGFLIAEKASSLKDYPEEFDFSLIESYGWYSPINSDKPNLSGVSRDHMVSVKYGWENNIDPKIISHPANCRLLLQSENVSKSSNCSITYEELLQRIEAWNRKYGDVADK